MRKQSWLLLAALLLCVVARGADAPGLRVVQLSGRVTAVGKGIAGVAVTDGRTVVRTDAKGRYRISTPADAPFVYLSLPDGYDIPTERGAAAFYRRVVPEKTRYDFALQPAAHDATRHRLIYVADPQVYFDEELDSVRRAAADIRRTASDGRSTFGVVGGDIIGDIYRTPSFFDPVRDALGESGIPFCYVVGNHDIDQDARTNDGARRSFCTHFGPTYYSFDRGRIHYVVLDDNFFIARSYLYVGYLEEQQLQWLEQDLALLPAGSVVVVCLHIPTWSRAARDQDWGKEESNKVLNNRKALYALLKPYRAHILSAHEHYNENYTPTPNITEHVHAPLSTLFWQTPRSMDGIPAGYGVYEIDGDSVSWYYKAVDYNRSRQFTAYGVGADRHQKESVSVNVWNYGPGWQVRWCENGSPRGEMTRYTGYDESIYDYVTRNSDRFRHKYIGSAPTQHLFYARPATPDARVRIEVTDPFGNCYEWDSVTGYKPQITSCNHE